jgi:hypothetical protein
VELRSPYPHVASSRDYHAYRSQGHVPGDLIPIASTNTSRFWMSCDSPTVRSSASGHAWHLMSALNRAAINL